MTTAASSEEVRPALEILPGQVEGPLSFPLLFGNTGPVEVEIGSGKGRFLLEQAAGRGDTNFLGLEWSLKYLRIARERAERRGLTNFRLLRADARHVIADLIPDDSVARVHVYCPDPWPKKRHRKRRFFGPGTARHLERILAPGGHLHVSTDVDDYFEEIRGLLAEHTGLAETDDPLFPIELTEGRTSYEVKYVQAGRRIHRVCYARGGGVSRPRR
jgi:tRNA (guanine-N7-)-methyltransferase